LVKPTSTARSFWLLLTSAHSFKKPKIQMSQLGHRDLDPDSSMNDHEFFEELLGIEQTQQKFMDLSLSPRAELGELTQHVQAEEEAAAAGLEDARRIEELKDMAQNTATVKSTKTQENHMLGWMQKQAKFRGFLPVQLIAYLKTAVNNKDDLNELLEEFSLQWKKKDGSMFDLTTFLEEDPGAGWCGAWFVQ